MKKWMHNFLRGFGSVLEIWPEPRRHALRVDFLEHSIEEGFRRDAMNVALDFNAALARARREVPNIGSRFATQQGIIPAATASDESIPSRQPA